MARAQILIELFVVILVLGVPFLVYDLGRDVWKYYKKSTSAKPVNVKNTTSPLPTPPRKLKTPPILSENMISTGVKLVYMTAPSKAVASDIARALVSEKFAACVNIIPGVESHYVWEGKAETSEEVVMLAKTTDSEALSRRVKSLHPYDVPCVVSVPLDGGEPTFLEWVKEQSLPNMPVPEPSGARGSAADGSNADMSGQQQQQQQPVEEGKEL